MKWSLFCSNWKQAFSKWNINNLATWCEEPTYWKRPWCWERLKVGGKRDDRGWDGWMASPMQWTWVWVSSRSWWWTRKPGMLQSIGSQRVGHNWATELNQQSRFKSLIYHLLALGPDMSYFSMILFLIENNNIKLIWPQQDFLHFLNRTNSWVSISAHFVQLFAILWTAACQASLSIINSWSLLKLKSIELVMPSNHLILGSFLLPPSIFPSIRVFSDELVFHIRWPKYWSFSFSISPSNEYSGLISFRMDWFDLLAVQGTL